MAYVPMSVEELEMIVSDCARDLLEKWAIESEIEDSHMPEYAAMAADTAAFIIDAYMTYFNDLMLSKASTEGFDV